MASSQQPPLADAGPNLHRAYLAGDDEGSQTEAMGEPPLFSATEEVAGFPLDPEAKALFAKAPWLRKVPVFNKASAAYGPKTTVSLGVTYLMVKGVADQLIKATMFALLVQRMGATGVKYQRLAPMASMGWAIKAFTAMFSDAFALFGYTKRWYIAGSAILGGVFALALGVLPAKPESADLAGAFIFLTSYFKANFDILAEGHYSRLMRRVPAAGTSLVTWIWLLILIGYIIACSLTGPLSDKGIPQVCCFVAAALQAFTVIFPIFNWYGEMTNRQERWEDARNNYIDSVREHRRLMEAERDAEPISDEEAVVGENKDLHPELSREYSDAVVRADMLADDMMQQHDANGRLVPIDIEAAADEAAANAPQPTVLCCGAIEMNREVLTRDWKLFVYCVIMTAAVLAMMVSNILATKMIVAIVAASCAAVCCGLSFWALPMVIAKANVFAFLHMMCYLNIAVLDNFYTAVPDCVPGGPHFSLTFYRTFGGIIGNIAGIAGTLGFNYIFSKRSYRVTFMITCSAQIIASVFDIIMVKRWNKAIGIPDHAMYICGDGIIYQVAYMLQWMPLIILISRLCPRGSESVVYALIAGFANLGTSTSSVVTSLLMEYAWPIDTTFNKATGKTCDFSNLVWLILVGHFCTPLLIFPLTLLLPSARCCDDLDVDGHAIRRELTSKKGGGKGKSGENGTEFEPVSNSEPTSTTAQ